MGGENWMEELIKLLMRRDSISENEAYNLVEGCQQEIHEAIKFGANLELVEDIVMDWLGLEPDYLELLL
jgi:hypothetical protein